jgi:hypothetical protein
VSVLATIALSIAVAVILDIAAMSALVWRYRRRRPKTLGSLPGRETADLWLGRAPVDTSLAGGAAGLWASGIGAEYFDISGGDSGGCADGGSDSSGCSGD